MSMEWWVSLRLIVCCGISSQVCHYSSGTLGKTQNPMESWGRDNRSPIEKRGKEGEKGVAVGYSTLESQWKLLWL